jgi:hypothetical protein
MSSFTAKKIFHHCSHPIVSRREKRIGDRHLALLQLSFFDIQTANPMQKRKLATKSDEPVRTNTSMKCPAAQGRCSIAKCLKEAVPSFLECLSLTHSAQKQGSTVLSYPHPMDANILISLAGTWTFFVTILWLIIGWRAMKAHERLRKQSS